MRNRLAIALTMCANSVVCGQCQVIEVGEIEQKRDGPTECDTTSANVPPDPVIAVDSESVVVVVNSMLAVYDKDNIAAAPRTKQLWEFFDLENDDIPFDVGITWDPGPNPPSTGRFAISALHEGFDAIVAVSSGGLLDATDPFDPNDWRVFTDTTTYTDAPCGGAGSEFITDQPSVGFTEEAWWITSFAARNNLTDHTDLIFFSIDKSTGATASFRASQFENSAGTPLGCISYVNQNQNGRAIARATVPRGGNPPFAYFVGIAPGIPTQPPPPTGKANRLRIYAIGEVSSQPVMRYHNLAVEPYDPNIGHARTCATGAPDTLLALDGRIAAQVYWRDEADGEYLYCAHSIIEEVDINGGQERKEIRWYKIKLNGWPDGAGTPSVEEWHQFNAGTSGMGASEAPVHLFYPALAANADGDVAIVMAQSSANERASIQATGREDGEMTPTFARTLIKLGDVCTIPDEIFLGSGRWGDYFGIALDPDDDTFWIIGQWMVEDGDPPDDGWGTTFAHGEVVPD